MSRRASGIRAWMWQRASAVYMLLYLIAAGAWLLIDPPGSHEQWRAWMAQMPVNLATAVFFWALLIHAWVGARDVLIDYVDALALRLVLLAGVGLVLVASGFWSLRVLFGVLTGG